LFEAPAHPYTRSLIAAIPVISAEEQALKPTEPVVEGEIPSPANQPAGCAFHTRCPRAFAPCDRIFPDVVHLDADHFARCHLLTPGGANPTQARTRERAL
jgi:peptide/nickel transport system ATP-binding protein